MKECIQEDQEKRGHASSSTSLSPQSSSTSSPHYNAINTGPTAQLFVTGCAISLTARGGEDRGLRMARSLCWVLLMMMVVSQSTIRLDRTTDVHHHSYYTHRHYPIGRRPVVPSCHHLHPPCCYHCNSSSIVWAATIEYKRWTHHPLQGEEEGGG